MKAIEYTEFGPPEVLHLAEVEKPAPKENEILIKVHTASVNYGDIVARDFSHLTPSQFNMPFLFWLGARFYFGLSKPKVPILGSEFAGEVEAVGQAVTRFKPGDRVFGYRGQSMGAYAEYLCMPEDGVVAIKPANMSDAEATTVPSGGMTALHIMRGANIQPGQKVLIIGASGGIGSHAVQIAKDFGAEVTGLAGSRRLEFVKSLGADKVIDYTKEDFTQNGETYDLIFDVLGRGSFARSKGSLAPNGRYVLASFKMKQLLQMVWTKFSGSRKVICSLSPQSVEDLRTLKEMIEAGKIKAVVDREFPLEQTAEAHRYVEQGHKQGHVIINVAGEK
ncbi:MAG: NAD(P)-dependent alcohol dehydrogenase [Anaerolineae bacterium]